MMKTLASSLLLSAAFTQSVNANTLILMIDLSGSVPREIQQLQIDAYAATLYDIRGLLQSTHIEVIGFATRPETIASGKVLDVVAQLQSFEPIDDSNNDDPFTLIWTSFDSSTCIGKALDLVLANYSRYRGKVVLDFSADGKDNCGVDDAELRKKADALEQLGTTINVLPILAESTPDIVEYLETLVMSSDGFSIVFDGTGSLEESIYRKVSLEVSMFFGVE